MAGEPEVFDATESYRDVLTTGMREAIGNTASGGALAIAQFLAWGVARRRAQIG